MGKLFFKLANSNNETSVELLMFLCFVGVFISEYLPTAVFVENTDKLFDSFNRAPDKTLCSLLSDNSPHISHWNTASKSSLRRNRLHHRMDGLLILVLSCMCGEH